MAENWDASANLVHRLGAENLLPAPGKAEGFGDNKGFPVAGAVIMVLNRG